MAEPGIEAAFGQDAAGSSIGDLHRRVHELTADIGAVLHANSSILFMADSALETAIRALGPNPFSDVHTPSVEEVDDALTEPAKAAARAIESLRRVLAEPGRAELVSPKLDEELAHDAELLMDFVARVSIGESRASTLRTVARRLQDTVDGLPPRTLPKEVLRTLRQAAHEVERRTALAALMQTRSAILQMDYTIRSLREFVTADLRRHEPPARLRVARLLESVLRQLADYAHASGVEIRRKHEAPGADVVVIKRELVRALANLLHNAVKYSWRRDKTAPAWVEIRVYRQEPHVCIAFENWGVPISAQEVSEGVIFELGYRGKWSTDRGRLGTGVGLTDARDIVEKHRGRLTVESRPARHWGPDDPDSEEYYRQPFVTTVTVRLPEAI